MRLWIDGTTFEGDVFDLRALDVDGDTIVAAILDERLSPPISCAEPTALFQYAGFVTPEMGLRTRTALATGARTRGATTPLDDEIATLRTKYRQLDPEPPSMPTVPDPVPERVISDLEETVATHRGRIEAHETHSGAAVDEIRADLQAAVTRLTERVTEQRATEQTRTRRREAAREYRTQLEKRRQLGDRLANQERSARAILVKRFVDEFATALEALPGPTPTDPFDAEPVGAALAIRRLAAAEAPVVLEADRFPNPAAAASYLGAPVIRC